MIATKQWLVDLARQYVELGFRLVATQGTADVLERAGMVVERVYKVKEGRPNVVDLIKGERIQLIVNTPHGQDTFFDEKSDSPSGGDPENPHHHDHRGGQGGGGGNCRDPAAPDHRQRPAGTAPGTRRWRTRLSMQSKGAPDRRVPKGLRF